MRTTHHPPTFPTLTPRSHPAGTGTGAPRLPPPSRPPPLAAAAAGAEALEGLSVWATEQSAAIQEVLNSLGGGPPGL